MLLQRPSAQDRQPTTPSAPARQAANAPGSGAGPLEPGAAPLEPGAAPLEPGAAEVRRRLTGHGASQELVAQVLARVRASGAQGTWAIDVAARELAATFYGARSPKRLGGPHFFVFVGPTGVGKTSVLAKLGRKLVESGRKALFATLDPLGASAIQSVKSLSSDVDRMEIPLAVLRTAADLKRSLALHAGVDAVLVDTPGISASDSGRIALLARELARIGSLGSCDVYLVLAAGTSRRALAAVRAAFDPAGPTALVATKLDETDDIAPVLEEARRADLPLAFLCDGQDVRGHLMRATGSRVADLFLRGRIS